MPPAVSLSNAVAHFPGGVAKVFLEHLGKKERVVVADLRGDFRDCQIPVGQQMRGKQHPVLDEIFHRGEAKKFPELRAKVGSRHSGGLGEIAQC